jgi:hypothetical protein
MALSRGGKHLKGGQKLGFDYDHVEPSNNHRQADLDNSRDLQFYQAELQRAEREGRWSRARKMRRIINQCLEINLYLRSSWCGGCMNYMHNCQCEVN